MTDLQAKRVNPSLLPILAEARERIANTYGDRLMHVLLYGSQARGEAGSAGIGAEESDIDVLVVLKDVANEYDEFKRLASIETDFFSRYRVDLALMPYDEAAFNDMRRPFIQNVRREGIAL